MRILSNHSQAQAAEKWGQLQYSNMPCSIHVSTAADRIIICSVQNNIFATHTCKMELFLKLMSTIKAFLARKHRLPLIFCKLIHSPGFSGTCRHDRANCVYYIHWTLTRTSNPFKVLHSNSFILFVFAVLPTVTCLSYHQSNDG